MRKFLFAIASTLLAVAALSSTDAFAQSTLQVKSDSRPVEIVVNGAAGGKPVLTQDGAYMAIDSGNGAQLWDVKKRRLIRTLKGLGSISTAVALSPDGKRIAGGAGKVLLIWNVETGAVESSLDLRMSIVEAIAFSKDGRRIIYGGSPESTSKTPSFFIRDIADGRIVKSFVGTNTVHAIDVSPDGRLVAFGDGGTVRILDSNGASIRTIAAHNPAGSYKTIYGIQFSPDGRSLASGGNDGTAKLWDSATGRQIQTLPGHNGNMNLVNALSWSPDGATLATVDSKTLRLFDTRTGKVRASKTYSYYYGDAYLTVARYMPDGRTIITNAEGLALVDAETLSVTDKFGFGGYAEIVQRPNNYGDEVLLAQNGPRKLLAFNVMTGAIRTVFTDVSDPNGGWTQISASRDGQTILAMDGTGKNLLTANVTSGAVRYLQRGLDSAYRAQISPDGQLGAVTGPKTISLVDVRSGSIVRSLSGNEYGPSALSFAEDGRSIVTAWNGDYQLRVHSVSSGASSSPVKLQTLAGEGLSVSPDGSSFLAIGTSHDDYAIDQYSTAGPRLLKRMSLPIQGSMVTVGDFHPDGRQAAFGSFDGAVRVFSLSSGGLTRTLLGHDAPLGQVKYLAQGRRILSISTDGMKVWDTASGELLVTYILVSENEWLAITPEGFFEAAGDAAKRLNIVRGLEIFSIDQFYDQLHRPDLVKQKLAGDPDGKVRQAAVRLDLGKAMASGSSPSVRAVSPADGSAVADEQVAVEVEITDEGGGIGKVEWRLNGTTVGVQSPAVKDVKQISARDTIWLVPGDNKIEIIAYNAQGLIASQPTTITVRSSAQQATTPPRLFVIAVGVNDYWDSALRLNFAAPDATAISEGFKLAGAKLYDSVDAVTVLNSQATAANLDRVFSELSQKVRPQDVFVFFMSGHGKTIDGRFYFIPQDFRYSGESSIVSRGIGQDQLQAWFARIKAQKSILLFDACESGALIGERIAMRGMEEKTAIDLLTRAMGRTVLTATTDDKPAAEGYRGHGVFTYSILSALGDADSNGDGIIDVLELANFVDKDVPALTFDAWKMRQVPQMKIVGSNFPLLSRTALPATARSDPRGVVPNTPTHVAVASAAIRDAANTNAAQVSELRAGTQVRVIESAGEWALVARGGNRLGYVESRALLLLQ